MNHRPLPRAQTTVSEIGLGCWQLGGSDWGAIGEKEVFAILDEAVSCGITFWDTADVYGGGRSEELIGRYLALNKPQVRVATKLGRTAELYPGSYTEKGVRQAVENSLRRLGTEALDLIQLHCIPTPVLREGAVFDWLRTLQAEGKVRAFGASVESMEEAELCLQEAGLASLQIIFNLFRQKPLETVLPKAREMGVGIIVRLPLASGLLSGKFTKDSSFAPGDHRSYNRDGAAFNVGETFAGLPFATGVQLASELRGCVPKGTDMAAWAQRWILDCDAVSTIITGASKPAQVRMNASAASLPRLSAEQHEALARFYREKVALHIRGPY